MQIILLLFSNIILLLSIVILIPILVIFIECSLALIPERKYIDQSPQNESSVAILIPAHNEALVIGTTLKILLKQLNQGDRLIVIADNCDDETIAIAQQLQVEVLPRNNTQEKGKGYALDYGLKYLANSPPDLVIFVDADCIVEPGTIRKIAEKAQALQRPVQAVYLMEKPANPTSKDIISTLAFRVKNLVRPYGLSQLGFPCLLTGTGMAFPWDILQSVSLASGNIVEDMQLGIDLAIAGYAPILAKDTQVIGRLPQQQQAATVQRKRWEHGHIQTLLTQIPQLLKAAFTQKRFDLIAIALDLSVPPLSLLVGIWFLLTISAFSIGLLGSSWLPFLLTTIEGLLLSLAIITAWVKFAPPDLPISNLLAIPFYILWKIPLYLSFLIKPQKKWIRTERD